MPSRWVVDASPLILLGKVGLIHLLTALPDKLTFPEPVAQEVQAGSADDPALQWLLGPGKVYIQPREPIAPEVAAWDLGRGESAVLSWAYQRDGWVVLVDDLAARRCAKALGIAFTGTVGSVLAAKDAGLIAEVSPVLDKLVQSGLRLSSQVLASARRLAREL